MEKLGLKSPHLVGILGKIKIFSTHNLLCQKFAIICRKIAISCAS